MSTTLKNVETRRHKYNHIINKEIALTMALQENPDKEIAARFNVSIQAVNRMLKPYRDKINGFMAFKEGKANVLEYMQYLMCQNVDEDKIKKVGVPQTITGIAILQDKIDQIRGNNPPDNKGKLESMPEVTIAIEQVIINQISVESGQAIPIESAKDALTINPERSNIEHIKDKPLKEKE